MKPLLTKVRPAGGFSQVLHLVLTVALPILMYVFVRIDLPQLAIVAIFLSKWRMFSVRPRYWIANLRANAVDILAGLSFVVFMTQTSSQLWQLIWAVGYVLWLLLIKPGNSLFSTSLQALVSQMLVLMALYMAWAAAPAWVLIIATWAICYVAARHFFTSFDEPYTRLLSSFWAFFGACLAWVTSHWLLYYGIVAQPALLLVVISFCLASMYYLENANKLSVLVRRQFIFITMAIIVVVLVFSDWGDKTV